MTILSQICDAVEAYNKSVEDQVRSVRSSDKLGTEVLDRWRKIRDSIPMSKTPTGLELPRLALPDLDEAGAIARYLGEEGLPGEFPFVASAYREMYLERPHEANGNGAAAANGKARRASKN